MDLKRIQLGTPAAGTAGVPFFLPGVTPPLSKKWLIRNIHVVHHGIQAINPPAYLTMSAGPAGASMSLQNWLDNAIMWAAGPHYPLQPPYVYDVQLVLNEGEQLAAAQFHRALPGNLVADPAQLYLNIWVSALEVDA